jgi:TPR repeat protein
MRIKLIALLCITISCGTFAGAQDFQKGLQAAQNGDFQAALIEWSPLAEQGDATAQYNLGVIYYNGLGVGQDYQEAVKWYRLAAEQGDVKAQYNLGLMYYNGDGVVQDYVYAHMWFNISASLGLSEGTKRRDIVSKSMTTEQISQAQQLARECVQKNYKGC